MESLCYPYADCVAVSWSGGECNVYSSCPQGDPPGGAPYETYRKEEAVVHSCTPAHAVSIAHRTAGQPHCPVFPSNTAANDGVCGPGDDDDTL